MEKLIFLAIGVAIFFGSAGDAQAYLDPGTGSVILQVIAAAGLGAIIGIKVFWRNIKNFIGKAIETLKPKK